MKVYFFGYFDQGKKSKKLLMTDSAKFTLFFDRKHLYMRDGSL